MTVINQNSISGITSITAASGSVQIFNSDGSSGSLTDLAGVNVSGVVTATRYRVGTAVTIDASGISATAGVVTATTYRVSAGSTAAPAITPPDDTNTGIFFPSADTIAFGEGGAEAARIDSSGRFGLGTATVTGYSSNILHLHGSTGAELHITTGGTGTAQSDGLTLYVRDSDGSAGLLMRESNALTFGTTDNERARIDSSGRFGIGTTSPVSTLNVSVADGGNITISSTNDGHTSGLAFGDTSSNSSGRISYDHFTNAMRFDTNGSERVRLDSSGRLLVGTSSSSAGTRLVLQGNSSSAANQAILHIQKGSANPSVVDQIGEIKFADSNGSVGAEIAAYNDLAWATNDYPGRLVFSTTADGASSPTERMRINSGGSIKAPGVYNLTTASAANVFVASDGDLARSTSSSKYKTDIETIQDSYSDALLNCRPVWYRSTCVSDNSNWGWWGFIAEEVASIDPRLVHWKTVEVTYDEKGSAVSTPCDPEPEGVAYDRFVPHLLNLIKRQKEQIEAMEARLSALESA